MNTSADDLMSKGQGFADRATAQARDMAGDLSDSIVSYTKNNPAKALGVAAAAGALLYVVVKALTTPRD